MGKTQSRMLYVIVFKLISLAETGINIHTYYEYAMEQVKFAENLKETNAKTIASFTDNDGHDFHGDIHRNRISDSADVNHSGSTCHFDEPWLASVR